MDEQLSEGLQGSAPQQGSATDYDYYSAPISIGSNEGSGIRKGKLNKDANVFSK